MILDIHTHHPAPQPYGVISVSPENFQPVEGQLYSIGIHPWQTDMDIDSRTWEILEKAAAHPQTVAIGETGIDNLKGAPLFLQMQIFKKHIEISERLSKPLILHNVRAHDVIIGIKKDLKPRQDWVLHGFRGKPTVAGMMTDEGIYLSFGEKFNPDSLNFIEPDFILAETDESQLSIFQIIENLSLSKGSGLKETILRNTGKFLNINQSNVSENITGKLNK